MSDLSERVAAAFREIGCVVAEARSATQRDYVLCGSESTAADPSPVSAGVEASGGAGEAQEG